MQHRSRQSQEPIVTDPAARLDPPEPSVSRSRRVHRLLDRRRGLVRRASNATISPRGRWPGPPDPVDPDGARGTARERLRRRRHLLGVRLGPDAIASVGLTESLLTLVYALAMGLGIGADRHRRSPDRREGPEGAAHAAVQASCSRSSCSHRARHRGRLLAPRLLGSWARRPSFIATGRGYATIMLGGEAAIIVLFLVNAVFRGRRRRGHRDAVLWLANIINMCSDPCCIFGPAAFPEMGVTAPPSRRRPAARSARSTPWYGSSVSARSLRAAAPPQARPRRDGEADPQLSRHRHPSDSDRDGGLDRSGADGLRYGGEALGGYTMPCGSSSSRCCRAGGCERGGDDGGPGAGSEEPGAGGTGGLDGGGMRCLFLAVVGLVRVLWPALVIWAFTGARGVRLRASCLRIVSPGLPVLRLRDGAHQRSTAPATPGRRPCSTSFASGCGRCRWRGCSRVRPAGVVGRVLPHGRLLAAGRVERAGVSSGRLEVAGGLTPASAPPAPATSPACIPRSCR